MIENNEFARRHIGPDKSNVKEMLEALNLESLDSLIDLAVPTNIREASEPLTLPEPLTEAEALAQLREIASKNEVQTSLIGLGYYDNFTPGVIQRNILENPAWYTAYTPYQPEISQGRLEALLNYQTLVCELTGCELSNASLLDEPTAVAEAMTLLYRVQKSSKNTFLLDSDALPQTKSVVITRAEAMGINVVIGDPDQAPGDCFAVLYQYPGASGEIRDLTAGIRQHKENGILVGVSADLLALTLLTPPGELGADVVVGSSQRFGVPMGFGGPHAGYIAVKEAYKRSLPGRLVGASRDAHGNPAFRLALQTREQHIRREKATSNICTAQVLLAIIAGMYGVYHGPEGLKGIAQRTHSHMNDFVASLTKSGYEVLTENWFDTITIKILGKADLYVEKALQRGLNIRLIDSDHIGVSFDETTNREIVNNLLLAFTDKEPETGVASSLPEKLLRKSSFCQQPVFSLYR
ncbi:MAG: glycine dehydrogenase, partial [Actinomycetota bacterium]|nr:glycine dehydrogenase [Actinomycetota bacterium]